MAPIVLAEMINVNLERLWRVTLVTLPGAETLGRRRPGLR